MLGTNRLLAYLHSWYPVYSSDVSMRELSKRGYMIPGGGITTSFSAMAVAPAAVLSGGALDYTGGDFIYAFQGNTTTAFWRYSISGNSWATMAIAPAIVAGGGALVHTGGDFIYAFQGGSNIAFWRYSISGNSWATMVDVPAGVSGGGALAYTGGDFIYAFSGGNYFWRTSLLPAPIFLGWQPWMR